MRKTCVAILTLIVFNSFLYGQVNDDTIQARIVLIGDGGEFNDAGWHPVVNAVKKNIKLDKKTTIIYLGDNLYKEGLPDEQDYSYEAKRAVLDTQINIARNSDAHVYFIPGNHDWDEYGEGGLEAVIRQQNYIDAIGNKNLEFLPNDGCPGPVARQITPDVVLITMDTQWWLHEYEKPGIELDCPYKTKLEVLNELDNLLDQNSKKLIIIAMHHPLKSNGIHGGYFKLKQFIFPLTDLKPSLYLPLPFIGAIYPIARGVFGTPQDLKHPNYANMIAEIQKTVRPHKNVIFVAGHEHNQQLIRDSGYYYIVSGAGAKQARVSQSTNSMFVSDTTGFATLEISDNKNVTATFYNVEDSSTKMAFQGNLLNFNTIERDDPFRVVYVPFNADSISIAANPRYASASKLKRFFNGDNYRKEWATPVKMKIFYLNKMGMTIESLGGGRQTKSLTLRDKNNKRWVLRTIDKDLENLLPDDFKEAAAVNYLRDFVSTAHPYAPLIVPDLAKAAGVVVANPKLFFVPNDNALGMYRPLFANKVVMLEEKDPAPDNADTRSTTRLLNKMIDDNEHHVEQSVVLRARLLDFLLADWDRHFDQWRFGETDTGKGKLYYPIPRDRDEALAFSNGITVRLLALNALPYLRGFRKDIKSAKWLSYEARDFDRLFLNSLERKDWEREIKEFQYSITDNVIHQAVSKMPAEIYAIRGPQIEAKLRSRRDQLMAKGMEYYSYLAKEVTLTGSNNKELYKVTMAGDKVQVRAYKRQRTIDSVSVMYNRQFDNETEEIRFFGLGKDDIFEVDEDVDTKIKMRFIGGKGDDTFNIRGHVKNMIYDLEQDDNFIINGNRSKVYFSEDVEINDYAPTGFEYNKLRFPLANLGYNVDDGFMAGAGISRYTHGFRKEPYASFQHLSALYAFGRSALKINYLGDFTKVWHNAGLQVKANLVTPVANNFFGYGNNTSINNDFLFSYNQVRYNYADAELLLTRRKVRNQFLFGAGGYFYHYWNHPEDNWGKVLNRPSAVGLDSVSVFQEKTYAGIKAVLDINTLNNDLFATRGILWNTQLVSMAAIQNGRPITYYTTNMTVYSSFSDPANFIHVLRLGGGRVFSKNFEYFQAMNLGQNNYLRGYRKNRFTGRSSAYVSSELRFRLFNTKSYFLPGTLGVLIFGDVGRVWQNNQSSKRWHLGYGGGLYYSAYNRLLLSATMAFSPEETLFNFSLGTKFNLNL